MVKIVFSDFDDTMLHYYSDKNYFDDYQLGVLRKMKKKGIQFGIVTGRCVSFFFQFSKLLEFVDYILASNGACIYDVKSKCFIYSNFINSVSVDRIIQKAIDQNSKFIINSLDKRYQYGNWPDVLCDTYQEGVDYSCEQLVLAIDRRKMSSWLSFLSNFHEICVNNITNWDDCSSIDINAFDVSKGNSIVWLCNFLKIDLKYTLAFGDGENDISMFQVVDKGVAVGNACDKLKQFSYDVSLNCIDNGIYKYLEDNILNR